MATNSASTNFGINSANNKMDMYTGLDMRSEPVSAIGWFYLENTPGTFAFIFTQEAGAGTYDGLDAVRSDLKLGGFIGSGDLIGTTTVVKNRWEFGSITFPGGTGNETIFLNNIDDGTMSATGQSEDDFILGAHPTFSSWNWDGEMAFQQIYKVVLSLDQMTELSFNPFAFPENLEWFPDLLDTTSLTFTDLSPKQLGSPSIVGSLTTASDGPPVFLLGGQ